MFRRRRNVALIAGARHWLLAVSSCVACLFSLDSSLAATDQNEVAALLQQKAEWGNPPQLRSWAVGGDPCADGWMGVVSCTKDEFNETRVSAL
ncbi:unnamed protein product [Closterium sp. NIES-53]